MLYYLLLQEALVAVPVSAAEDTGVEKRGRGVTSCLAGYAFAMRLCSST